jgi:GntR family transcriptional regulator
MTMLLPEESRPAAQPLYLQVEALLMGRIAEGLWPPGTPLPSEMEIGRDLGVSQGTVRKALQALERRRLIERRQGRGTFVAEHTSERALFHFFRVADPWGRKPVPTSRLLRMGTGPANNDEARRLHLPLETPMMRLLRLRLLEGRPCILEQISLPAALFPHFTLPLDRELTDEMYVLYQRRHGVTVMRAEEELRAIAADAWIAEALAGAAGQVLLEIDRVAFDVSGQRVERRLTWLDTTDWRYRLELE